MTLVAVVWGGKAGFRKQTQMGFCSKDPQTDSGVRGTGTEEKQSGTQRQRLGFLLGGQGQASQGLRQAGDRSILVDLCPLASDLQSTACLLLQ